LPHGLFENHRAGEELLDVARNEIFIDAPAEQVFELLGDPRTFSRWVVGTRAIRAADGTWPQPGAAFDHSIGIGPLQLRDHTSVVSAEAPEAIELHARAIPFPPARVRLQLRPEGNGTHVTMEEAPANRLLSLLLGPLGHWLLTVRNAEALRRLKLLAEGKAPLPTEPLPERDG
jgi:uncharacterized protein YndB with AHSA1/START domain